MKWIVQSTHLRITSSYSVPDHLSMCIKGVEGKGREVVHACNVVNTNSFVKDLCLSSLHSVSLRHSGYDSYVT